MSFVTQTEVARALGVPRTTVNSWVRAGHVDTVTINGKRRVSMSSALEHAAKDRSRYNTTGNQHCSHCGQRGHTYRTCGGDALCSTLSIKLGADLLNRLKEAASSDGVSRGHLVRQALEVWLES